jgi:hypothetical protein
MRRASLAFVALLAALALLAFFTADRHRPAGVERTGLRPALDADPDLKLITTRSPYMRTER